MENIFGIFIIVLLFLSLSIVASYLFRSNMFSSEKKMKSNKKQENFEKLIKENEHLDAEIKFLKEKNARLKIKIVQMKEIITNLKEQKAQLEKSEKRLKELRVKKDETLSMVAHDIKNPASTIKNFVDLLESYDLSAQEQNDVFSSLVEASSRLVQLADEFTHVISEEFAQMNLNKVNCHFIETVDSIVKINKINAKGKDIDLKFYKPDNDVEVEMDEQKIKEVIDNLVNNAIKFCPEKSTVDVTVAKENNFVMLKIADNGFGLTEGEIFNAFKKGVVSSNKPTGNESSSGLGLWIAKKIVEEHNGKIWVKSKKGFGATFAFKIPIK